MWQWYWYADPSGPDPWRDWYDHQNGSVRGRHDFVFKVLESRTDWREPYAKKLVGQDGLKEVIISTRVEHRLLGFDWPNRRLCFTFLLSCTHKDKVYDPKNAIQTAWNLMTELRKGKGWIRRCEKPV